MSILLSVKIPTTLCVSNSENTRGAARPSPNSIGKYDIMSISKKQKIASLSILILPTSILTNFDIHKCSYSS